MSMDCNVSNVIYVIQCTLCRHKYIGQTSRTLRERFNAHKSTIINKNNKILASHINQCIRIFRHRSNTLPLTISPILTLPKLSDKTENAVELLSKETEIITTLKTFKPYGINSPKEALNKIPICLKYSDSTEQISKLFKNHHRNLQIAFKTVFRNKTLTAHVRNKNVRDHIITAALK